MKTSKDYIFLYLRGVAMGIADVVPGISGGTVALITGIYEELISTIKGVDRKAIQLLSSLQFYTFWKKVNGAFLLPLMAGIATSLLCFSQLIGWLIRSYAVATWSFFFGLILASAPFVLKKVTWSTKAALAGMIGLGLGYWVSSLSPSQAPHTPVILFFSGSLAVCAMILPGISGAFILLLLNQYQFLMQAIAHFDIINVLIFALGGAVGLLSFAQVLSLILKHHKAKTLTLLAGIMLGALNKVWPWKFVTSSGSEGAIMHQNLWPTTYLHKTGNNPQLGYAVLFALLGMLIVVGAEKLSNSFKTKT